MGRRLSLGLTFYFLFDASVSTVLAQGFDSSELETESDAIQKPVLRTPIEEITVIGGQSLNDMRMKIEQTEDEVYAFFNANNSSNRMDIVCSTRRPTGTNMRKRECEPRFLKELRVLKTRESRIGIGIVFNQEDLVDWSSEDFANLQNEMLLLMAKHPEFSDKLAELSDLVEDHEAQVKEMFAAEQ